MNINDRLIAVCKVKRIRQKELSDFKISSKQTISLVFNYKQKPSTSFIEKFLSKYEDINARWFMTGIGEMLDIPAKRQAQEEHYLDRIKTLERLVDQMQDNIDMMKGNKVK